MVKNFFWLVFISVPCGPLVQLSLCSTTELEQLVPEFFNKKQDARNGRILCALSIAKHMDVQTAGARLMAGIAHLHGLSQDGCPRHFCLMVGERHGVRHHLKAVVQ